MADSKLLNTSLNSSNSSSPPPNCAICLGSCSNKCFSDTCMHQFCFKCLLEWSKIKAECPLCKQPFKSIIHNVKSNDEYEEHIVEQQRPIHIIDNERFLYLPQSQPNHSRHHSFHFRTTFTVNAHGENAIQQMLLSHSLTNGISISNYMPGSWPHCNRRTRRDITTTTSFRRSIYNNNLWANAPADVTGRYREVSPEFFQENPANRTRLAPWLNRELNALLHENTREVMELVDTIMDYLLRYHICSRNFRTLLHLHLGARTDHFVHEFYNFMRSPFDMIGYDRNVIYTERPSSPVPFIDISEESNSDVIIIEETPVIIEVSSNVSDDDVIMTSTPGEIPKPQLLPACRSSRKRSKHLEVTSSSSDEDEERQRKEDRAKRRRKRKSTNEDKRKKTKSSFNLNDFVMNESSDSDLDDLPLAKYMKIKASIGKKILKRSLKERSSKKKSKNYKNVPNKSSTNIELSPKPHCSKYIPRRATSSSSSSSSSSSNSSNLPLRPTPKPSSSSNSPELNRLMSKYKKYKNNQLHEPSTSTSTNNRRMEQYDLPFKPIPRTNRLSFDSMEQNTSRESSWYNNFQDGLNRKSPNIDFNSSNMRQKYINEDESLEPLELTSHCRISPLQINPYVTVEQEQVVSPPILLTINPNLSRDVSQSVNFYNSRQSPDLIDLSISKLKNDPYVGNTNQIDLKNCQYYPSTSTNHLSTNLLDDEVKNEPPLSVYNSDNQNRYWTDFASQSTSLNNSNDSIYNFYNQPRKSVIQNFVNSNDFSFKISPRYSPLLPKKECWSDSSD